MKNVLVLVGLSLVVLMTGNNIISLTNPDEVFYAQTAKEMAEAHTWQVPYLFGQPQFEKPILTYWLLRLAIILFGVSNFGARFFPALCALVGVLAVYLVTRIGWRDEKKALLSAFVLLTSGLYIGLARTVFTDMIFSVFILLSLASFYWAYASSQGKAAGIMLFFIFSALAVLTKGPLGFIIPGTVVILFLSIRKELTVMKSWYTLAGFILLLAIAVPWYAAMIKQFGDTFTHEFFYNDHWRRVIEAEHRVNDTWFFYPATMVLCMFPWSVFVLGGCVDLARHIRMRLADPFSLFILCWVIGVFGVFQVAHSKLTSYIVPLFPALAIIAGDFIFRASHQGKRPFFVLSWITWVILAALPLGLIFSAKKYSAYMPAPAAIAGFVGIYILIILGLAYFLTQRRVFVFLTIVGMQVPFLLAFTFSSNSNFEAYVSSKPSCDYLMNNYAVSGTVLCSKLNVRGVRYWTNRDVAAIGINAGNYWSPHPIPFLNTEEKAAEFFRTQPVTYCIVSKSSLTDIKKIAGRLNLEVELLKVIGDKHIVVISPSSASN